ncbi:MAG TPA: hypothetical protein VK654_16945 [Nitrospirota bacterium]|nr:hypothetical protein [Nitrospirota bacterium]
MRNIRTFLMPCIFTALVGLAVSCTVAVKPGVVPGVKGINNVSLKGVSLIVVNGEKDALPFEIPNEKGQKIGITANKQAWTGKLVEALSGELAKRGAQIRSKAPLQLTLAIPEIVFSMPGNSYQFTVKVAASSSKGWSKNFEGTGQTTSGLLESTTALTDRLAGLALSEAVKAMLSDADFLKQLNQ